MKRINFLNPPLPFRSSSVRAKGGQILVYAILFLAVIIIIAISTYSLLDNFFRFNSQGIAGEQATTIAEGGVDYALKQLNDTSGTYTITNGPENQLVSGNFKLVSVGVSPSDSSKRRIVSLGCVPNCTTPRANRKIQVEAAIGIPITTFQYLLAADADTLTINKNLPSLNIQGGVKSNNNIVNESSTSISICGSTYAAGTISGSWTYSCGGQANPNCNCLQSLPAIDFSWWEEKAAAGGVTDCSVSDCTHIFGIVGPRKFIGNITLSGDTTLKGAVYVTGSVDLRAGTISPDDSLDSAGTMLIADGTIDSGRTTLNSGNGFLIIASKSGPDYKNGLEKVIQFHNISTIYAVLYAPNGKFVSDTGISGANFTGAIAARGIKLDTGGTQPSTFTFDQRLLNAKFAPSPTTGWYVDRGSYKFLKTP